MLAKSKNTEMVANNLLLLLLLSLSSRSELFISPLPPLSFPRESDTLSGKLCSLAQLVPMPCSLTRERERERGKFKLVSALFEDELSCSFLASPTEHLCVLKNMIKLRGKREFRWGEMM